MRQIAGFRFEQRGLSGDRDGLRLRADLKRNVDTHDLRRGQVQARPFVGLEAGHRDRQVVRANLKLRRRVVARRCGNGFNHHARSRVLDFNGSVADDSPARIDDSSSNGAQCALRKHGARRHYE